MDIKRALPAHNQLLEPDLLFANSETDKHPLRGLINHGPYSMNLGIIDDIKIAFMTPSFGKHKMQDLLKQLRSSALTQDAKDYYPNYPSFESVYRVPLGYASQEANTVLPDELDNLAASGGYVEFGHLLLKHIQQLKPHSNNFDVLLIYIPDTWSKCFKGDEAGYDLHDYLKALVAPLGIAFQIVGDKTFSRKCRSSVMWNLSLAIYAKSNGIPWKLNTFNKDEAFIGISYALKKVDGKLDFCTCCSQIYEPDGLGFEFVAFDTKPKSVDRANNPYLSAEDMQAVLTKSLRVYQKNHRGRSPKKITIHKNTHFSDAEIEGALDSFNSSTKVELVQIVEHTELYGIKWKNKKADGYGVSRGTYQAISENEALLWIKGPSLGVSLSSPTKPSYKDFVFVPTPRPVLLRRFSGDGGWHDTCQSILSLTKMDWNQTTLYKKLPVTLQYSSLFAQVLKQNPNMTDQIFDFRCFM